MTIPAPTKTWQYDVNDAFTGATAIATQSEWWLRVKAALIGFASNPWVVDYSCDGAVAGTAGDAVDRWVDAGDVVFATSAASAHSWIVLRNAVTGMELLIECITNHATQGKVIKLAVSAAAGFTGGGTTASPTATDQRTILLGTIESTIGLGDATSEIAPSIVLHALHSSDGQATIIAMCHANACTALAYLGIPDAPVTGWTTPRVAAYYASNEGPFITPTPTPLSWNAVYKTLAAANSGCGPHRMYGLNLPVAGAAGAEFHLVAPAINVGNATTTTAAIGETFGSNTPSVNNVNSEHEVPRIGLHCVTAGDRGTLGLLFDVRWCGDQLTTGDTVPAAGTRLWVKMGPFLIPWNGSVPVIA